MLFFFYMALLDYIWALWIQTQKKCTIATSCYRCRFLKVFAKMMQISPRGKCLYFFVYVSVNRCKWFVLFLKAFTVELLSLSPHSSVYLTCLLLFLTLWKWDNSLGKDKLLEQMCLPQSHQCGLVYIGYIANPRWGKISQLPDFAVNLKTLQIFIQTFSIKRLLRWQHVNKCCWCFYVRLWIQNLGGQHGRCKTGLVCLTL